MDNAAMNFSHRLDPETEHHLLLEENARLRQQRDGLMTASYAIRVAFGGHPFLDEKGHALDFLIETMNNVEANA